MKKLIFTIKLLLAFVCIFMHTEKIYAQDLVYGQADIVTYSNAAPASVLKSGAGITISQIGTEGVAGGTPKYFQINNSNATPVLNSTGNDAVTISAATDIQKVIITYASNSGSTQPYVGFSGTVTAMGSATVAISSCTQAAAVGTTQTAVEYTCPASTKFLIMVRGKACSPNAANTVTIRITQIAVYLTPTCATIPAITNVTATSPICFDATTTLTANGVAGVNPVVTWFTAANGGGTNLGTGTTLPNQGPGTYYARVTGDCGNPVEASFTIQSKVNPGIASVTAPASSLCPSATQLLTANGVTGTGAVVNWFTAPNGGGSPVGTNTSTITVGPGTYYARVTGDCTPAAEAFLTVNALATPSITAENLSGNTYIQGDPANALSITASGGGTITYQWYKSTDNVVSIDDATVGTNSNSYTPLTTATGTLYYYCIVSGCSPAATSSVSGAIVVNPPAGPTIVKDETGFSGAFGNQPINTTSAPRSFKVNGSNLTEDILVTAPAGFEVSLSSGSGYAGSVPVTQSGGIVDNVTVYVHFAPTSAIPYPGNVQLTSAGATEVDVAVSGTGVIPAILLGSNADMNFSVTGWTTSTSQSRSVTGTDLAGNINVSVGAPFEVSTTGSGGWGTTVSYTPSAGSVSGTLFVRYNPSSGSGLNSSTVTLSSSGATNQVVNVNGKAAPLITLSSGSPTQSVKAGVAIGNINYTVTGGVVSASSSPLPSGVTLNGSYTISGTPGTEITYPGVYNYTVTIVGPSGTSNATANGTITVTDPNALNIAYIINTGVSANDLVRPHLALNHNLTNILIANVTTSTDFSPYDLVILTEAPSSGSAGMRALWGINKPLLNMKAFATGSNTWVFSGGGGVDATGTTQLDVIDATHPIFNGVTITGGKVTMLSGVGTDKAIQATTYAGGTKLAYISGSTTNVAINEIAVGTEPSGATAAAGVKNEVSQAKYIQIGLADISWNNLTADGFKLIDNAVQYLTHNVITATAGANGSISPSGVSYFNNGANQTYTITPDANYHIASVLVDGSPVALADYTFSNITANHTIAVTFAVNANPSTTWQGTDGANWNIAGNWTNGIPTSSTDVIINNSFPTLDVDFTIASGRSLAISGTGALVVAPGRTLTVTGTADFGGKSVTFRSDNNGTASLGQVNGTLSGATNVTVERYIPNNGFRSWRLLSVPVTSTQTIRQAWQEGDLNPLPKDNNFANHGTQITGVFNTQAAAAAAGFDSTSVNAGMLRWNSGAWANITSTNQPINNFNSYFLYIRGERGQTVTGSVNSSSATTLRTKGTVFTGDQLTSVGANAFALIPNLYPSSISFTGLTRTGGVNNLFYIWDSKKLNGNSLGTYQTFSSTNSFNCMIAGGSYTLGQPNTVIESGQSFFVTSAAAGTITLKESAKVSGSNGSLGFRPTAKPVKIDTRLYNDLNEMLDANAVVFSEAYEKAVSTEDAPKMGNPGANFAIEADSKLLAIEGTQPLSDKDVIQFRMWNLAPGNYKLEFATTNLVAEGLTAMLEDSYLGTSTTINLENTTSINFNVNGNAGSSAANRFRIVFSRPVLPVTKQGYSIAPNPIENGIVNIIFSTQPAGTYRLRILGAGGETVSLKKIDHPGGTANYTIRLTKKLSAGTYVAEITGNGKEKRTQILLVK